MNASVHGHDFSLSWSSPVAVFEILSISLVH